MRLEMATGLEPAETGASSSRRVPLLIALGLVGLVLACYLQTAWFDFLNFDDNVYLADNPNVREGLSWENVRWAFFDFGNTLHGGNWHPLTWLALMIDVEIYGDHAAGFHINNVIFHTANVLLLFAFLRNVTKTLWPSAMVAALFAVHPLNVESVAWVAERKGLMSTTWFLLALFAYAAYVRRGGVARYLLVALLFALGLMTKPVLVTFPFVLLLLDYWPFRRFDVGREPETPGLGRDPVALRAVGRFGRLFLEKAPLLLMTIASCSTTYLSEQMGGSMTPSDVLPLGLRLANSLTAYLAYLQMLFFPVGMAIPYPLHIESISLPKAWFALGLLMAITCLVVWQRTRHPWAAVGWFWFVGMLVPLIKIVHVGREAYSDKFTYVPAIGIFIAVVFGLSAMSREWANRRAVLGSCAGIVLVVLVTLTILQTRHWRDSITLFTHTLAHTERNYTAYSNRGLAYQTAGKYRLALEDYNQALAIKPRLWRVYANRGLAYRRLERLDESVRDFTAAILALTEQGDAKTLSQLYESRGQSQHLRQQYQEALADFDEAIRLNPNDAGAYAHRGAVWLSLSQFDKAILDYQAAHERAPQRFDPVANLAWIYATCPDARFRDGKKAVAHARRAMQLSPARDYAVVDTLAAALAEDGQFVEAARYQQQATELAPSSVRDALLKRLELYRQGKPYRDQAAD
ncbi:MAG: tetratricopeptide repeat protein [Planctomycetota bacterium]|nr:MAG: tetratricopeptide repeat protein [Planctomycetota bacterium]